MTLKFTVNGKPHGKARPRFDSRHNRTYTPDATRAYEELVRLCYRDRYKNTMIDKEITAYIIAYFPIPKNTTKIKREGMLSGEINPTGKPDTDNIIKIVFDALIGYAYKDDAVIVNVKAEKRYSIIPRVEVILTNERYVK